MLDSHVFVPNKLPYLKGNERPAVECILCAILEGNPLVTRLIVYEGEKSLITLNLYPYNPGHLMIFPKRHLLDIRQMDLHEEKEIQLLMKKSLDVLDTAYSPSGYNIGWNIGESSGASIAHIHLHIVPRYRNEIGFMDIIGGAKIMVEDPLKTRKRLTKLFKNMLK